MFRRILVPLDGSKRAEKAIPVAARIARASGGTIVFVEVVLPPVEFGTYTEDRTIELKPGAFHRREDAGASYLTSITKTYADELAGIHTELDLTSGAPSPEIYKAARLEAVDLIIFCTHGETGLKRWAFGSIAQEAIRHSPVPVLILNEHGTIPVQQTYPLRVLVPLDGSTLSESAILPAAYLVSALSGSLQNELHLFRVVDLPSAYGKMKSQAHISDLVHDEAVHEAEQYMKSVSERYTQDLAAFNILVSSFVVDSAFVAGAILHESAQTRNVATSSGYDLIAMATHGRGGLLRRLMGSVTEQILGTTKLPMFVVRPQSAQVEIESEVTDDAMLVEITEVEVQSQIDVV
ncbi:MAG TPA: universal stress protein [Ktedonobacteraceae bacterium]|nr:universal stress protein [Ktedonobacteraceae bacterium]